VTSPPATVHSTKKLTTTETRLRAEVTQLGAAFDSMERLRHTGSSFVQHSEPSPNPGVLGLMLQPGHMGVCFMHPTRPTSQLLLKGQVSFIYKGRHM
jgi:hypothetical protein